MPDKPAKETPVIIFTRKVVKNSGSLRITIPKEIAETLNIEQGDEMEIFVRGYDSLIVRKKKGN